MPARNYYAFDDNNCRFETITKEQILATIRGAMQTGLILDEGGVYSSVEEINKNANIKFWLGTKEEYNAVTEYADNVLYLISDEETQEEVYTKIQQLADINSSIYDALRSLQTRINLIEDSIRFYLDEYDTNYTDMQDIKYDYNNLTGRTASAETSIDQINRMLREQAVVLFDGNIGIQQGVVIPLLQDPLEFKTIDIVSGFPTHNRYSHYRIYTGADPKFLICFTWNGGDIWNRTTFEIELDSETNGGQNRIKIIKMVCDEGNSWNYVYTVKKVTGFTYQN